MSAAELKTCEAEFKVPPCIADVLPMEPVTTQVCVSRAIPLTGLRNRGSFAKKGAGDSGQTIKSALPGVDSSAPEEPDKDELEAASFTLRSASSRRVRSKSFCVQVASTERFSCTSSAA